MTVRYPQAFLTESLGSAISGLLSQFWFISCTSKMLLSSWFFLSHCGHVSFSHFFLKLVIIIEETRIEDVFHPHEQQEIKRDTSLNYTTPRILSPFLRSPLALHIIPRLWVSWWSSVSSACSADNHVCFLVLRNKSDV